MVKAVEPKFKTCSVVLIIAVALSVLATPLSAVLMAKSAEPAEGATRSVVKAKALQIVLGRALALNLSQELRAEVEALVNVNVSSLTADSLSDYIAKCREILARIAKEVERAKAEELDRQYVIRLRMAIEVRLRFMAGAHNISLDYALRNLSEVRNREELRKMLRRIEGAVEEHNVRMFMNRTLRRAEVMLGEVIEKAEVRGLEKSIVELNRVTKVLSRVIERLEKLNISTEAVEHLRIAVEHISIAKDILSNISANITTAEPGRVRERVRGVLNKTLEGLYNRVNETLNQLKLELQELMERALEANATEALEKLEILMQKVDNISQVLQLELANITADRLREILMTLSRIKAELKFIEKALEVGLSRWMPEKSLDRAYNVTLARALKNLDEVKKLIDAIENKSKDIVCIAVYPPPPPCRYLPILPSILHRARALVAEAEELINKSIELYSTGLNKILALHLVSKANVLLVNLRAWLMPIYNTLNIPRIGEVFEKAEEMAKELSKRLEEVVAQIENLKERLNKILGEMENLSKPVRRAVEKLLNDVKELVNRAEALVKEARRAIEFRKLSSAEVIIADIERTVMRAEHILSGLERILSQS